MKKLILFLMIALSLGIPRAMAEESAQKTWSSSASDATGWRTILGKKSAQTSAPTKWLDTTANSNAGLPETFQWSWDINWGGTTIYCSVGKNGVYMGSSGTQFTGFTLSTEGLNGKKLHSIKFKGCESNEASGSVSVMVNNTTYTSDKSITKTAQDFTFDLNGVEVSGSVSLKVEGITVNKQFSFTGLEFVYSDASITPPPLADPEAPTFAIGGATVTGETVEVAAGTVITASTVTDGASVTLSVVPAEAATINGATATITADCKLTATATVTSGTESKSTTSTLDVTIKQEESGSTGFTGPFYLLTDLTKLQPGVEVIIAYDNNAVGAANNKKFSPATITLAANKKSIAEDGIGDAYIFTLSGNATDGWYLKGKDGYINASGTGNTNVSYDADAPANKIMITESGDAFELKFTFTGENKRALCWSTSSPNVFGHYIPTNSGYENPKIYYRDGTTPEPTVPEKPVFTVDGNVLTTYEVKWGEDLRPITVTSEGATSLIFTSPEELTTTKIPFTFSELTKATTIIVKGHNDAGDSEESTFTLTFEAAPVIIPDAPTFAIGDVAVTESTVEVESGAVITASTVTANATVTLTAEPAEAATIDEATATAKINAECTLTATATVGTESKISTLSVKIKKEKPVLTGSFKLLTDLTKLQEGMEVIIASGTNAVGKVGTGNDRFGYHTITISSNNTVALDETADADVTIFTLEGNATNGWYLNNGDKYLTISGDKTAIGLNKKDTSTANYSKVTFAAANPNTNNLFMISLGKITTRSLSWYNKDQIFRYYTPSDTYLCPNIYYRDGAVADPVFTVAETATTETGADGKVYYTNPFELTISSDTEGAVIHYTIGEGSEQTGDSPVTITVGEDQTITAYATKEGVTQSSPVERSYSFRTGKPTFGCTDPEDAQVKTVTISSATEGATVEYRIDEGEWTVYTGPLTFDTQGTTNITARARSAWDAEGAYTAEVQHQVSIYPMLKWQAFERLTDITRLVDGDEVVFTTLYDNNKDTSGNNTYWGLKPYVDGNNCKALPVTPETDENGKMTLSLDPSSEAVGIYKVEKTDDGKYRFKGTFHGGYLAAMSGNANKLVCLNAEALTAKHASVATVIVDPLGEATVTFEGAIPEATNNVLLFVSAGGAKVFSCYDVANITNPSPISIYRRGAAAEYAPRPVATPQEGVFDAGKLTEVTLQCKDAAGNVVTDPSLEIWYTTDGTDPRTTNATKYTAPIPVTGNLTIRAYATMDGYFDSPSLIASYDIFRAGKQYRRVTGGELKQLRPDDDIIILGSPSDSEDVYAMSRQQVNGTDSYREAVKLDKVVKKDGRITINKKEVQVLSLIPASDYYTFGAYDWRLYASGTSNGSDYNMDGFLIAQGNNNSLETMRIDTPASELLPNADVRFRSRAVNNGQGNEYGGVTVQFGSPDGHENDYPKFLALTRSGDGYRFDIRSESDFGAPTASSESWYVSVFKIFDPTTLYPPTFTNLDRRIEVTTPIEIISPNAETNPETEIYYSLDEGTTWTLYTEPFFITTMGQYNIWARARNTKLAGGDADGYSVITEQKYTVTDTETFELVTDASTLKENDRIVFVNAVQFFREGETVERTGWFTPADFDTSEGRFNAEDIEVDTKEIIDGIPRIVKVPGESNIQVFRLEYDTSASNPERPWLLNVGDVDNDKNEEYLQSAKAKKFGLFKLPEDVAGRQYMNVGFDISDSEDYNVYIQTGGSINVSGETNKGIIVANAIVTFNGTSVQNYLRFNPSGGNRFRGYDNGGQGEISSSSWPVRVYRAAKRVLPPTVTVFDAASEEAKPYETEIEDFTNPVRVVIRQNPNTDRGSLLRYSWSKSVENAPVLSEYLKAEPVTAEEIELLVDGNKVQILKDGEYVNITGLTSIEGKRVFRAVATNGEFASQSLPRQFYFHCAKPILGKVADKNEVSVSRPAAFTVNATLYYAYDDDEMVKDDAHRVTYKPGTSEFMDIPFTSEHTKVRVIATKAGYADSEVAVYTPLTFTPQAHAIQLLELTPEGKTEFGKILDEDDKYILSGDDKVYVTYRTMSTGQFYLIKEDALDNFTLYMAPCTNNATARQLIDYRPATSKQPGVNVKWTTDYYVYVLEEGEFYNTFVGVVGENIADVKKGIDNFDVKVYVNGSTNGRPTQVADLFLNGEAKTYRGMLLKRHGAIGTITLKSELKYDVLVPVDNDVEVASYTENGYDEITPRIPSVYGGSYAYTHTQPAEDLVEKHGTDFLKFSVQSSVYKDEKNEVLIPAADLDPRHLDAVITFYRPNVSDEILLRNDIYYTVKMTGSDENVNVKGSGLYVDRTQAGLEGDNQTGIPQFYQFTVTEVSPRADVCPTLEVVSTEYVENQSDNENYGRFIANYGKNLKVEAANSPTWKEGSVSKVHLGYLSPGVYDRSGNQNKTSLTAWMYKGHNELYAEDDVLHQGDETADDVKMAPVYYHIETTSSNPQDYASYEYLVKHVAGHNEADTKPLDFKVNGEFITDDEDDPLLGTYIATHFQSMEEITVYMTPVYIFSRNPAASPEESGSDVIAPLKKVQAQVAATAEAPKAAPSRTAVRRAMPEAPTESAFGKDITAPTVGETRPMRHYGHTDMNAANITDLTDTTLYDVVAGNAISKELDDGMVTGVENVAVDVESGEVEYYNLQGVRIARPDHGIFIERRGNTSRKVVL